MQALDRSSKHRIRSNPEKRQAHKSSVKQLKASLRADPLTLPRMQALDRSSKHRIRSIPEKRQAHKSSDKQLKAALRVDPLTRFHMQAMDRTSKQTIRIVSLIAEALQQFKKNSSKMPIFTCCLLPTPFPQTS